MHDRPYLAVVGPTGTGKSDLALELCERWRDRGVPAEVVNADAMQLYRGMDIGTAKVPPGDRRGVPHHQLDVLEVTEEASVAAYQGGARADVAAIHARGAVPILVGGSGLYVSSVLFRFEFPGRDQAVREHFEERLRHEGADVLYKELGARFPDAAAALDPRNERRLVRALEVVALTGAPPVDALPDTPHLHRPVRIVGLRRDRTVLEDRLDRRVEAMWRTGLLDEVAELAAAGIEQGRTAQRAIGYAQALAQYRGELAEDEAIAQTQQLTRRYARRQVGWFRRYREVLWVDAAPASALLAREVDALVAPSMGV